MFKDLNEVPPSGGWFPYEYIDAEFKNKVEKTKGQLTSDELVEYLNHDTNWLKIITVEIDKFLIDCEYINLFIIMYI